MNLDSLMNARLPVRPLCGLTAAAAVFFLSCNGTGPTSQDLERIVVEAYLCAGQPLDSIRVKYLGKEVVSKSVSIEVWDKETGEVVDTVDTVVYEIYERYISDAVVKISGNGASYPLVYSDSGWYVEPTGTFIAAMGQAYRIDVSAGGQSIWAETTVPTLHGRISLSRDTLYLAERPVDTCGKYGCEENEYPEDPGSGIKKKRAGVAVPDSLRRASIVWNTTGSEYVVYYFSYDDGSSGGYLEPRFKTMNIRCEEADPSSGLDYVHLEDSTLVIPKSGSVKLVFYLTAPEYGFFVNNYFYSSMDSSRQDLWVNTPTIVNGGLGSFSSYCKDSCVVEVVPWTGSNQVGAASARSP